MLIRLLFVVMCFLIVVTTRRRVANERDWVFLLLGMFFTVLAETFWLFNITLAIAVYCFVPVAYALRAANKKYVTVLIILSILALPLGFWVRGSALSVSAILYFFLYIAAVVAAARNLWINVNYIPFSNRALALSGMLLFLVCDICMVVSYMAQCSMAYLSGYATWVLFPLAQLILALSALKWE